MNEADENWTREDLKIRVAIEKLIPVDMWIWNHLKTVIFCRYMYHQNPGMSEEDYYMPDLLLCRYKKNMYKYTVR